MEIGNLDTREARLDVDVLRRVDVDVNEVDWVELFDLRRTAVSDKPERIEYRKT